MNYLKGTQREWQTIFYISAGLFSVSSVIFDIFAKGEIQSWAKFENDDVIRPNDVVIEKELLADSDEPSAGQTTKL